jgi:putative hydroxymethylpyrimidine transport system substrate-binding protein
MRAATLATALVACLLACLLAACGSGASTTAPRPRPTGARLILDFTPNAVHTGIYTAIARRYDRSAGVRLHVIAPTQSTDSIKLLETGKVEFALLDIHDLAIARQRGADIVGIMAVVQRPLSAVIAAPAVTTPRELQGKTVGVTGVPSDTAVLRSVVAGARGDPAKVKTVAIGFNAVADLLAGRVAGATAFWNDEGEAIRSRRPGFHIFRVDDYGAPSYPELVLCATRATLERHPALARETAAAIIRGYEFTLQHPQEAAHNLEQEVSGLDPSLVAAQLSGLLPSFRGPDGRVGKLNVALLRGWAAWETRFGIVSHLPNVTRAFEADLTAAEARP